MQYNIGLDLGQRRDHTAIAVVNKIEDHRPWGEVNFICLEVCYAERVPLGTPYPAVVDRVRQIVRTQPLRDNCVLAVDATGVGAPVVDMMRKAGLGCPLAPIVITGGDKASQIGDTYHVPKIDLWAGLAVMLERNELRISTKFPSSGALARELAALSAASGAAKSGHRDDLAIALALAVWRARNHGYGVTGGGRRTDHYDPVLKFHCRL